ncbi:hypothetical protein CORC01_07208 [Colletotrichum orchidophilum]|uniref:Uncharacterized protein n=1 Tax=Colletotrichum orchidophilum TaxID=1209926 RepID=A0A1G4B7W2_9PEZI|nr:uncharacterized protein CORC01_07208 [Colletotrichum orchidophilum]OHE97426.1 hypothetical protein CORC01_07208 [Colletotrichum orchidophilum]
MSCSWPDQFYNRPRRPYSARYSPPSQYDLGGFHVSLPNIRWSPHYRETLPNMRPQSGERYREDDYECRTYEGRRGGENGDETDRARRTDDNRSLVRQAPRDTDADERAREGRLLEVRLVLNQMRSQLDTAHKVHNNAFKKFQKNAAKIRVFASQTTLNRLWVDMLSKDAEERQTEADEKRTSPAPNSSTVVAQVKVCLKSLERAEINNLSPASTFHDKDSKARHHFKIIIDAVKEAVDLADKAPKDHLACQDLVERLDRARILANTQSEIWKPLLRDLPAGNMRSTEPEPQEANDSWGSNDAGEYGQNDEQSGS